MTIRAVPSAAALVAMTPVSWVGDAIPSVTPRRVTRDILLRSLVVTRCARTAMQETVRRANHARRRVSTGRVLVSSPHKKSRFTIIPSPTFTNTPCEAQHPPVSPASTSRATAVCGFVPGNGFGIKYTPAVRPMPIAGTALMVLGLCLVFGGIDSLVGGETLRPLRPGHRPPLFGPSQEYSGRSPGTVEIGLGLCAGWLGWCFWFPGGEPPRKDPEKSRRRPKTRKRR